MRVDTLLTEHAQSLNEAKGEVSKSKSKVDELLQECRHKEESLNAKLVKATQDIDAKDQIIASQTDDLLAKQEKI